MQDIRMAENDYGKFILPVLNEFGAPLCPEMHDMRWIDEQRSFLQAKPNIFEQEYMLKAPDMSNTDLFGEELLEKSKDRSAIMLFQYTKQPDEMLILGTDFSIIENKERAEQND